MKTLTMILLISVLFIPFSCNQASDSKKIEGSVLDSNNNPLAYVNVYLLNTLEGGMTDESGNFVFTTNANGKVTIVASMMGYEKFIQELDLAATADFHLKIILEQGEIEMKESIVTGSAYSSEEGKGLVITSMDVMTTPGGAADIFQSLKTLPGLTQVSESAQLYVRGGDPIETITIVDQASLYHPYTYESNYGGLFSNLNTNSVRNLFFSSGGFSAKYGNALSGVLEIETKSEPIATNFSFGLSMAAGSVSAEVPIIEDKFGFRIYAQQSFTKPILWLNGELDRFTTTPNSKDLNAILTYKYSRTGRIKFMGMFASDGQGVQVERAEYNGNFDGNSDNNLFNLQQSDILFENFLTKNSMSYSRHNNNWQLGVLDLDMTDEIIKFRNDNEYSLSSNARILGGIEFEKRIEKYIGTIPDEDYDIRPDAVAVVLDESISNWRIGAYGEVEYSKLLGIKNLFSIAGARTDVFPDLNISWFDPRFSVGYKITENSTLKLGGGIFHQLPETRLFARTDGNPNLKPMQAVHYVLSYDLNFTSFNTLRIEAYHKTYDNLPLEDTQINYNNNGSGFANGFDVILKGDLPFAISGWISYGYINTKRKWMDYEEMTSSSYDITHNVAIILKYNLSAMWQIGINYKYATGRPFTPITGSDYKSELDIYEPVYGIDNSARYKNYERLDLRITHMNQMFGKYFTVFYVEALNILGIKNLFGYTYNKDYTEQTGIASYFGRRTVVFGMQISF
ncbi:MAG: TonB-dependent receptor [bacterium]